MPLLKRERGRSAKRGRWWRETTSNFHGLSDAFGRVLLLTAISTRTRTMDLPVIGAHCSLSTCNELDLLPLTCLCSQRFCKKHIAADAHECPVDRSATASAVSHPALKRCAVTSCGKPSLEAFIQDSSDTTNRIPALCSRCKLAFCVSWVKPSYSSLHQSTTRLS